MQAEGLHVREVVVERVIFDIGASEGDEVEQVAPGRSKAETSTTLGRRQSAAAALFGAHAAMAPPLPGVTVWPVVWSRASLRTGAAGAVWPAAAS